MTYLPIRTLRVGSRLGHFEVSRSVPCPVQGSIPLDRCRHCESLDRIKRDRDGREIGLRCHPQPLRRCRDPTLGSRQTGHGAPADPTRTPVSAIMTSDVICITCDFSLEAVAAIFLDAHIGALPVVDYESCPIGILSKTDLVRDGFAAVRASDGPRTFEQAMRVRSRVIDLMSPIVHTLVEGATVSDAAALMVSERLHHVPVVDEAGRVVGMFSSLDLARWIVYSPPHGA